MNHYLLTPGPDEEGWGFSKSITPFTPLQNVLPLQPLHALHLGASLAGT